MEPLLAEIRLFAFGFVPKGWAPCQGQLLPINQNQALFSLLGTMYGGNGQTTFALPDLRFRSPLHVDDQHVQGESAGTTAHQLTSAELPAHRHTAVAASTATTADPSGARWATTGRPHYAGTAQVALHPGTVEQVGGSQPHENMPPYLALQYAIALQGVFPSRESGTGGDPYLGEVRLFAGSFTPGGWAACDGQLMALAQNTALFSLLGTTYGGNGMTTFGLPDLRGASPIHHGQGPGLESYQLGEQGGTETVMLTEAEMPAHTHTVRTVAAGTTGTSGNPSGGAWATSVQGRLREQLYSTDAGTRPMSEQATAVTGGGVAHNNMSPYLAVRAIIALQGDFPPRS
ncbi:phage tail protein [Cellulomonas soli]|uniref:phage tail protein n=1 Tax=Cellulomonas soli TaxID=931535 RepID=UPI003F8654FE